MSPEDMKNGVITGKTLCGEDDPEHSRLTFAIPDAVVDMKMKNYCPKCRKAFLDEYSGSQNRNARRRFRQMIADIYSGKRANSKGSSRLLIK
jgi:hypothetical protein